jgi:hypothetical protein
LAYTEPRSSLPHGPRREAKPQTLAELCARYELEMDHESVPGLVERFDLRFPGEPL